MGVLQCGKGDSGTEQGGEKAVKVVHRSGKQRVTRREYAEARW